MFEREGDWARRNRDSGIRTRKRVLVFDASPVARSALTEILADEGYVVEEVAEAREIAAKIASFAPHVLLLDLDVWEPPQRLLAPHPQRPIDLPESPPVVGMTMQPSAVDFDLAAVLGKAVDVKTLLETLARVIEAQAQRLESASKPGMARTP